ncbi:MAG: hypothetical protein IJ930_00975 [Lachnospiraceae bacterium]|nr:hypothetical protein [Lachnospiraceae bacterium]
MKLNGITAVFKNDRRLVRLSLIYGTLMSLAVMSGRTLEKKGYLTPPSVSGIFVFLLLAAVFSALCGLALVFISKRSAAAAAGRPGSDARPARGDIPALLKYWAGIFAAHFVVLLAEYPGFFVYDATDELFEFDTRTFTTHHPLLHELLMGISVRGGETLFGNVNAGIFLHILFQMLLITLVLSIILLMLEKAGISGPVRVIIWLFYAFFPPVVMFSLCSSKDTPFSAFLLLSILLLYRRCTDKVSAVRPAVFYLLLAVFPAASMLFRHNAFYAWLVYLPLLLLFYPNAGQTGKKPMVIALIASLVLYLVISSGLQFMLKADKEGPQEMLTVPIQQLARLWNDDPSSFTDEELEILYRYIPASDLRHYRPSLSDPVKSGFNNDAAREDLKPFLALWAAKGMQHPVTYLNAWLMTSYGYWYPGAVINVYAGNEVHTFTYRDSSYFGYEVEYPGERHSLIPAIDRLYRKLSIERFQQEIPVISLLFAPASYLWLWLLIFLYLIWKKDRQVFSVLPVFLYMLTLLLGPTYLVRYVIPLFFGLGILPLLAVSAKRL